MLVIRVVSFKGQPVPGNQTAQFGEAGGTIGRGRSSTLVLQDPELFISRTHATISYQAGGFIITDNGTKNPVVLNGQPLGFGGGRTMPSMTSMGSTTPEPGSCWGKGQAGRWSCRGAAGMPEGGIPAGAPGMPDGLRPSTSSMLGSRALMPASGS